MLAPLPACWNGNGIECKLDENSSFDNPATTTFPSTKAMSVIASTRGLLPRASFAVSLGASGRLTTEYLTFSSESSVIMHEDSVRTITGTASGPRPRDTDTYTRFDNGFTFTS